MKIDIVCPVPRGSRTGNRVTAERWRQLLSELGHRVRIVHGKDPGPADVLIVLHATRSAHAVARFREKYPRAPIVVAITGTDLYQDLAGSRRNDSALTHASRIVALNPLAAKDLPPSVRGKTRVILQSAVAPSHAAKQRQRAFTIVVVGHLRRIKDPFRAEEAVRGLPAGSRIRVRHIGRALEPGMERPATRRAESNPRWTWLGERTRSDTIREIARANALVLTSRFEGGANVISEAIVCGVPVLSSRISCSEALLGRDYPGLFPVGDTAALRAVLLRLEAEPAFRRKLAARCRARRPLFSPARERRAWRLLLAELRAERTR